MGKRIRKTVSLKDGREVVIRTMRRDDADMSHAFFLDLPRKDRAYLRNDVTQREVVERRIRAMRAGNLKRLVSVTDGKIVADGTLILDSFEWKRHVGELRLIVAKPYQRKGLGTLMARELYALAASEKVEEVIVKMMEAQTGAIRIFTKLGFREQARLPDYVKDLSGKLHDLVVMRCDLEELWQELESYMAHSDWQRTR